MKTRTRRFLKIGIVAFLTAMSALLAGVGFLYGRYIHDEPIPPLSIFEDNAVFENFPFSARIFAKDQAGSEFVEVQVGENYLNERRYYIAKKDLPKLKTLTGAILATEDRHFYAHPGVNPFALLHAAIDHYLFGKQRRGASTISQQLVKNILRKLGLIDMSERGTKQKIQEIYLAIRLEQYLALKFGSKRAAKEHLLWLYLNTIPMGRVNGGFAAAAYDYFGVTPEMLDTLTAEQALVLAALPKGPEKYLAAFNPASANYSAAHKALNDRIRYAAEGMRKSGTMTPDVFKRIKDTPFTYTPPPPRIRDCNEFVTEVRQSLSQNAELLRGFEPLEIYTTCVVPWQRAARQAVKERSEFLDAHNGDNLGEPQGAAVFMETNGDDRGAVSVLIGNKDPFPIGTFNRALAARRAAGSTFKAPVYYLLMRDGLTPNSSVSTARVCLPPFQRGLPYWCPKNAHPTSLAIASAEESLTRSINTATARFAQKLNNRHGEPRYVVREMIKLMVDTGIPREALDFQPSLPLGPSSVTALELTQLYATLTHDGKHVKPFLVESCRQKHSDRSCQLGEIMRREERQVADPKAAGLLTRMLISASRPGGTVSSVGQALNDEEAAVKSGTSQSNKNAWVVGGTKDIAGAVWYGFDDESSGLGTDEKGKEWQGGRTAGPVWAKIARAMLEGRGRQRFVAPPGIVVVHFVKERLRLEDGSEAIGIRCAKEEEQAKGKFSYTEWYPEEKRPRCIGYLSKRIIPPPLTPASVVPTVPAKNQQPAQPLTRTQVKTG